ncbi:MAG TPA: hypothetical protein VGN01_17310 [Acidobacteriaceae bacterium]
MALLGGQLPYRDFFTTGPPLNALKSVVLLHLFGQTLIVNRVAGVLERLLIGLVLLRWLVQLFRPWHALAASVITILVSSGDLTDPIASYNHDAVLFAMVSGLCASFALERGSERRAVLLAMAAGAAAALSLLTKQTVGLGALACVGLAGTILLGKLDGKRRALVWSSGFCFGSAIPLVAVALWLWREHIFRPFFQMLFVAGPEAKAGHASDFVIRHILVAKDNPSWVLPAVIGLALSWRAIRRGIANGQIRATTPQERILWVVSGILLIGTAEALAFTSLPVLNDFSKCSVYFVLIGLTLWLAGQMAWLVRSGITRREAQAILFGAVAWSIAIMLSLSWPAFEPMVLPGLGFMLAATLDGVQDRFKWFPLLVMAAMVFLQVRDKLERPFGFDGQVEAPAHLANAISTQPQLRGMRLSPQMASFLDQSVEIVQSHTQPGDPIFTYPEMGLLYPLTGRKFPTWSGSHNIDVANDAFARQEAARLTSARPAVIFYYRQSEATLREQERMWRGGQRSGQRDIIASIENLVKSYRLAGTYTVTPEGPPIYVYIRP